MHKFQWKPFNFIAKTSLFMVLSLGMVGIARAEYWIDSPPIGPVGCGYVYGYGFSSCHSHKHYKHKYKHRHAKYHQPYYKKGWPKVNYRVEAYFYGPVVPACGGGCCNCARPVQYSSCNSCSSCGTCGSAVEWVRSDGSYYSDVTMGGYPRYSYVDVSYSTDMTTGDDFQAYGDVNYGY